MKSFRFLVPFLVFILPIYIITGSCKAGKPLRKTLPEQPAGRGMEERLWDKANAGVNSDNNISPGLPFYATDTTINGKDFTAIYLRDPSFDSLAFGIIKSYEPFAGSLLKIIGEQGIKGVLIDFRQNIEVESGKANFLVSGQNDLGLEAGKSPSIDIIFLWDDLSSARAAGFINELRGNTLLAVKNINNKNSFSPAYRQDCFTTNSPDFN